MTREELVAVRTGNTQPGTESLPADFRAAMNLMQKGLITRQQLETAQAMATAEGRSLASTLVETGADEDVVVAAISEVTKTTSVARKRVVEAVPGPDAMALFPLELSRAAKAIPLGLKGNQLMVAMADPMDAQALELLKRACPGKSLLTFRAGERAIVEGRSRLFPDATELELETFSHTPSAPAGGGFDMMSFVDSSRALPAVQDTGASPTGELLGQSVELLMRQLGPRGVQGAELVALVARLVTHAGLSAGDVELARAAAVAMTAVALNANRPPWDVPKLLEFQDELGFGTAAEPFLEALHAFPARMPDRPVVKWLVIAFAFATHTGEARPSPSRRAGALDGFRARVQLAPPLFEALSASVV
jgi:Type II secretion system (T2SS), protein E, N-terminal domain